jgi:hypothetical protein
MNTTGQMDSAVGLVADVCKKYNANPHDVYKLYLQEYLDLIESQNEFMHYLKIVLLGICYQTFVLQALAALKNEPLIFVFKTENHGQKISNTIQLTNFHAPAKYETSLNIPVCDDNLYANVVVKKYWDLAGKYSGFDTLEVKPLTKFDHRQFSSSEYKKLDEILADKNSILRVLAKDELTYKNIELKSETVDAVTGATPTSVKEQVVEGAVYSVYTLWHFVNGSVKDSIKLFT